MKTMNSSVVLVMTIFFILATITTVLVPNSVSAAVNYPVIGQNLRDNIKSVRATGTFVSGEFVETWQDEYIVVSVPDHPDKGMLFRVNFVPIPELEGVMEPVLTAYNDSTQIRIDMEEGYIDYVDGLNEIYGATILMGQKIYFSAWDWLDEEQNKRWAVTLTWGTDSEPQLPGGVIDRTNLGILETEPHNYGFTMKDTRFHEGKFRFNVYYDTDAEINLEVSNDLTNWSNITYEIETIPETFLYFEGVRFLEVIVTPDLTPEQVASSSSGIYFRIK